MGIFISRLPHVAEEILEQLDEKSLRNCKEVAKPWQTCIDDKNLFWIRIIKIPTILTDGNTYLHLATKRGKPFQSWYDLSSVNWEF